MKTPEPMNEKTVTETRKQKLEDAIEAVMCPKLRDVLKWMELMKMTGNTATDYEHFKWCAREIVGLRQRIKAMELIIG